MENFAYYLFCAMCVGGALGVITLKDFVNSAMSMLLSMLGAAGLMLLMGAYFASFLMVSVYAGAVMVLFVFVVMLVGDKPESRPQARRVSLVVLWAVLCAFVGVYAPEMLEGIKNAPVAEASALAKAQSYGVCMLEKFMLPLQIAGVLLLAAMVGVIVIAKPDAKRKAKSDML